MTPLAEPTGPQTVESCARHITELTVALNDTRAQLSDMKQLMISMQVRVPL